MVLRSHSVYGFDSFSPGFDELRPNTVVALPIDIQHGPIVVINAVQFLFRVPR